MRLQVLDTLGTPAVKKLLELTVVFQPERDRGGVEQALKIGAGRHGAKKQIDTCSVYDGSMTPPQSGHRPLHPARDGRLRSTAQDSASRIRPMADGSPWTNRILRLAVAAP